MFFVHDHRGIIAIRGEDRKSFLQGLITNDIYKGPCLYTAMLSPQGKFQHDFFILEAGDTLYLTPEKDRLSLLLQRLNMYKLRSKVELADMSSRWALISSKAEVLEMGFPDPRHSNLGHIGLCSTGDMPTNNWQDYNPHRMALGVPDGSQDIKVDKGIILENNLDELHAIDWKKGCYMGQELMSRTKHVGQIRKRLLPVRIEGSVPSLDSEILFEGEKAGEMRSAEGDIGLALLRLEYVQKSLETGTPLQGEGGGLLYPQVPEWLRVSYASGLF